MSEKANDLLNKFGSAQFDFMVWNTPDNLVARDKARQEISDYIAELEAAQRWHVVKECNDVATPIDVALRKRIAELEGKIDQLTAHDATERQDDKSPNDTQTDAVVYGKWIPVSERLPEVYRDEDGEFIPFLVCENDKGFPYRALYDGLNWGDGMFVADVTHWMPLPTPPEVQK